MVESSQSAWIREVALIVEDCNNKGSTWGICLSSRPQSQLSGPTRGQSCGAGYVQSVKLRGRNNRVEGALLPHPSLWGKEASDTPSVARSGKQTGERRCS